MADDFDESHECGDDSTKSAEEKLILTHRQERKELQVEIQKLKHGIPKTDKKRKKEVNAQIAQMESDLQARHEKELGDLKNNTQLQVTEAAEAVASVNLTDGAVENCIETSGQQLQQKKPSKAQKRRDKKTKKDQERLQMIEQQEKDNLLGDRHQETLKVKSLLKAQNLKLYEIPSDGNCLYAAIVHQLHAKGNQTSIEELRQKTAHHMRDCPDEFLPFLSKQDTGEPYTPEEFEDYCHKTETTAEWGGQLEIRALSNELHLPIDVLQADTPTLRIGEEYTTEPVILVYHRHMYGLGEHYNSVQPRTVDSDHEEEGFS